MIELLCPKCKKPMKLKGCAYACADGHSFDVAKEGYVNLLLVNKKNSKNPGDNKLMATARDGFLIGGYYDFMAERLAIMVKELSGGKTVSVLDCGCGSGYYLRKIISGTEISAVGIDISKEAVKIAAKKDKTSLYAVASVFDLPFADNTFDVAVCVFSPYAFNDYSRVLKREGMLITVYPAEKHLIEIKERLYKDKVYENDKEVSSPLFDGISKTTLTRQFDIGGEDLRRLLEMTPYFYKTSPAALEKICGEGNFEVTASFKIAVFKNAK